MTFTLAALIVCGVATVVLGLTCYHLLARLDLLERAVQGGMQAPGRRLTRHEFEQRFDRALARSSLGDEIVDGLVIAVGAEYPDSDLARMLGHLARADGVHLMAVHERARRHLEQHPLPGAGIVEARSELGVAITPFVFVVDDRRIRRSQPVTSTDELAELLRIST